jgi:hypothetical protein
MNFPLDLWSLPKRRHTDALTNLIESHFYAAIPPEQRPRHHYPQTEVEPDNANADEALKENEKFTGKEEPPGHSGLAVKQDVDNRSGGKRKYSKRPLLSAINRAFFWRWWIAGSFKLCAGETIQP